MRVRRAEAAFGLRLGSPIDLTPLLALRLRTERLELRLPQMDEIDAFARVAERGVHQPGEMPFRVPWTDGSGLPGFLQGFRAFHAGVRKQWTLANWTLELGVWHEGEPLGCQSMRAEDYAADLTVETGSWLGLDHHGKGFGTEMREAVLALAFRGLGARAAISGGFDFNKASLRVSEKLGYRLAGEATFAPRGVPQRELVMLLTRAEWAGREHPAVEIDELDPCLPLFGL